jgi:tRNA modification GTPase
MILNSEETIAAISTTPGPGAIAVVRLSGQNAEKILEKIFSNTTLINAENSFGETPLMKSHFAQHGYIYDPSTEDIVDEVVAILYRSPKSYTGENLVEISCHGGRVICHEILALLIRFGARLARPGEFTERAFLNGKMDLTQAESVLDVIQAKTTRQGRLAVSALTGRLGKRINSVRSQLINVETRVVAGIDFPEEIGDAPEPEIESVVKSSLASLFELAQSARSGKFLRDGLKLALVGRPNAGKSSLLNQLLKFERAIVTEIPGTTRDSIEEILDLNGIPVTLVDTAGIRHSEDRVEQIGIERSKLAISEADLVLLIVDLSEGWGSVEEQILTIAQDKPVMIVGNKVDIAEALKDNFQNDMRLTSNCIGTPIFISATSGEKIDTLTREIENWVYQGLQNRDAPSLNMRQSALCLKAADCLQHVLATLQAGMPQDCLASDLKIAIDALSEISGSAVSEEIISEVFANFCIGK